MQFVDIKIYLFYIDVETYLDIHFTRPPLH